MTNMPGVFAAVIVRGASLVVWGVRDGRDAAAVDSPGHHGAERGTQRGNCRRLTLKDRHHDQSEL